MTKKFFLLGMVVPGLATQAHATGTNPTTVTPYVLTDASYEQNFNSLVSTGGQAARALPGGWQIFELGTGTSFADTNANGYYYAGSTTGQAGAVGAVSFGQNSSDRALGGRAHADVPLTYIGAIFQNGLGGVIDSLQLDYRGEQWVNGFSRATLNFEYSLDATAVNNGTWTSFSALDFLAPNDAPQGTSTLDRIRATSVNGNSAAFNTDLSGLLDGLAIADDATFGVRWSLAYISTPHEIAGQIFDVSSNDGLAIDDFRLTATVSQGAVPEPSTWVMMIAGFGLAGAALRSRRAGAVMA